jgi:replicative DNA helicase
MADIQHGALSKMIVEGDLRTFIDARITVDFFPDEKWRKVYRFLLDHWRKYSTPATTDEVRRSYPTYMWVEDDPQPSQYYVDALRERREYAIYVDAIQRASNAVLDDEEPDKNVIIRRFLHDAIVQANTEASASSDVNIVASYTDILYRLGQRRDNPGMLRGITTGFDGIDFVTGGLQPEQFIVITGVPKSGKSSFLLYMALKVFMAGKVPLFVGFEMSNAEQQDRLTSLMSGVSLTNLLNGTTTRSEWRKVNSAYKALHGMQPFIFSADATSSTTVSSVQSKIADLRPDVVFVDGIYMMESDRLDPKQYPKGSPQVLTDISRSLKQLAQSAKLPIVVSTQSLVSRAKGGLTLSSIGYTSAFGQDADVILGVERQADSNISKFHVMESRSGPRKDVYVEWDWTRGYVGEIDSAIWTPQSRAQNQGKNFGTP